MKTILFIAMSIIALLFTSCEKDEMRDGEISGGGKDSTFGVLSSENIPLNENNIIVGSDIQE